MSKSLTLIARVVHQGDNTFYETAIPAADLLDEDRFVVDRWNNTSQRGYQREINDPHSRRIGQYLRGKIDNTNLMPQSIVVNVRGNLYPKPIEGTDGSMVKLELAPNELVYVVDGQHRIEAAAKVHADNEATLENYEFGVTLVNLDIEGEMIQFKNLNTTANRPVRGLGQVIGHQIYNLTGVAPVTLTEQATNAAVGVAIRLSVDNDSPFYGKIAVGGLRKRSFHTTVQSAFVEAILPLFTNGRFSDRTLNPQVVYDFILNFWKAVEIVWPEAMANPDSSIIQRSVGAKILSKILIKTFNNLTINPTMQDYVAVLTDMRQRGVDDAAWSTNAQSQLSAVRMGYSLNKSTTLAADYLWALVDTRAHTSRPMALETKE